MYPKELFKGFKRFGEKELHMYRPLSQFPLVSFTCPLFTLEYWRFSDSVIVIRIIELYRYKGVCPRPVSAFMIRDERVAIRIYTDVIEWYRRRNLCFN